MTIQDLISEYLKDKQRDHENDCFNIVDGQIFSWNFSYVSQPTMEELQALAPKLEADMLQEAINAEAEAYLASTDFYIIRQLDCGAPCPEEIKQARALARQSIIR